MITRFFKALGLFLRFHSYAGAQEWTREDAEALQAFMASRTGTRLRLSLRNLTLRQHATAVLESSHLEYNCGYAAGFRGCISALESMASDTFEQPEPTVESL